MPFILVIGRLFSKLFIWIFGSVFSFVVSFFAARFSYQYLILGLSIAFYFSVFLTFATFLNSKFIYLIGASGIFENPYFLSGISLLPSNIFVCISIYASVYIFYLGVRFKIFLAKKYTAYSSSSIGFIKSKK